MNKIESCPICSEGKFEEQFRAVDHTVSKEEFPVVECVNCGFFFTNPIPDEKEIGRYYKAEEYVSHTDTKKGIINRIYHVVRKRAIRKKERLISELVEEKNLLDIGCGTGEFLAYCKSKNWKIKGLEPDEDARALCRKKGIEAEDISTLHEIENGSYDVVTMWHVLEHVYQLNRDLEKIASVIKPEGHLVVAVPNHTSRDAKWYGKNWAAWDVPRHLYHFSPNDIQRLGEKYDLELVRMIPMKYDAFYVSMLSEKIIGGNFVRAMWRGWRSNMLASNGEYSSQIYILKRPKRN